MFGPSDLNNRAPVRTPVANAVRGQEKWDGTPSGDQEGYALINNRQNGRRRGRGGPRPQGMDRPNGGGGNRPEPRSRGNAPQLHEKYKALARDAQLAGDRVQTEYYLQFADHYYRILNENRPRFDEQRPQRGDHVPAESYAAEEFDEDADEGDEENNASNGYDDGPRGDGQRSVRARDERPQSARSDRGDERPQVRDPGDRPQQTSDREDRPQQRGERDNRPQQRSERDDRPRSRGDGDASPLPRGDSDERPQARVERDERPQARAERDDRALRGRSPREMVDGNGADARGPDPDREDAVSEQPQRAERPRRPRTPRVADAGVPAPAEDGSEIAVGIDFDRLPPAITRTDTPDMVDGAGEDDRPRPVRRPRRPREDTPAAA